MILFDPIIVIPTKFVFWKNIFICTKIFIAREENFHQLFHPIRTGDYSPYVRNLGNLPYSDVLKLLKPSHRFEIDFVIDLKTNIICYRNNRTKFYLCKVSNWNIKKMCEICSKLTTNTLPRRCCGVLLSTSNIFHTFF